MDAMILSHLESVENPLSFFRLAAKLNGFSCQSVSGDLALIQKLNLPFVIELLVPDGVTTAYMTVSKMDNENITMTTADADPIATTLQEVKTYWSGAAFVPWKNFFSYIGEIPSHATADAVITLKMMLREIGFSDIPMDPNYDERARQAIQATQAKHGIRPDGIVGPNTKIVLYNEYGSFDIPHLINHERTPS
jgi:general secretion pathway protein A